MTIRVALLSMVAVAAIGCASTAKTTAGPALGTSLTTVVPATNAATTTTVATVPATTVPTTTALSVQHVGGAYSITTTGGAANIYLVAVTDPAQPSNVYETPAAGARFVGTKVTLKGVTGTLTGDINNDINIIGSDDQTYSPSFQAIAGCTNFASGEFSVSAGAVSTGCVTFEIPKTVTVKSVRLSLSGGGGTADWMVP